MELTDFSALLRLSFSVWHLLTRRSFSSSVPWRSFSATYIRSWGWCHNYIISRTGSHCTHLHSLFKTISLLLYCFQFLLKLNFRKIHTITGICFQPKNHYVCNLTWRNHVIQTAPTVHVGLIGAYHSQLRWWIITGFTFNDSRALDVLAHPVHLPVHPLNCPLLLCYLCLQLGDLGVKG